jgi:serine/threonine-protein kinase
VIHENQLGFGLVLAPVLATMGLGALSNALDVQFIPTKIRDGWQTGIRDRLWNSRAGKWFAKRLGAPEQSRTVGAGAFRATEAALGVAAGELFAALPKAYREQLSELPETVAALEARAAEARAELDVVAALVPAGSSDAAVLEARSAAAKARLAETVASLEGIRLDLLRLHAGAGDLAPLTTLIDAARLLGEDVSRLADAQREVNAAVRRQIGSERISTPA